MYLPLRRILELSLWKEQLEDFSRLFKLFRLIFKAHELHNKKGKKENVLYKMSLHDTQPWKISQVFNANYVIYL